MQTIKRTPSFRRLCPPPLSSSPDAPSMLTTAAAATAIAAPPLQLRRTSVSCDPIVPRALASDAATLIHIIDANAGRLAHGVQEELVIESVFHTPLGAPLACSRKWGDLDPAPPLAASSTAAAADISGSGPQESSSDLASKAACLATPAEPTERGTEERSPGGASRAASFTRFVRTAATEPALPSSQQAAGNPFSQLRLAAATADVEDEDALQFQLINRRLAVLECAELAREAVEKSAAVRRRRRLALVRALRGARALLGAPALAGVSTVPGPHGVALKPGVSSRAAGDATHCSFM